MAVIDRHWEHFAHEADMGVRGFGLTREEAFVQAALALTAVITDPESVATHEVVSITCAAPDVELLLVDWLNALVYEMATRNMLFSRFEIDIVENSLKGQAWGEKVDVSRHHPAVEIKGILRCVWSMRKVELGWPSVLSTFRLRSGFAAR